MDKISFIPEAQKNFSGTISVKRTKSFYQKYALILVAILVGYALVLAGLYWFNLSQPSARVKKQIAELDSKYQSIYPAQNIEQSIFNAYDIVSQDHTMMQSIQKIEQTWQPSLVVNSLSYTKSNKTLVIAARINSFESVIAQVEAISRLDNVAQVEFSNLANSKEGSGVSFDMNIILK